MKKTEDFIKECNIIHKNKFIYDQTIYMGAFKKVIIKCPKHGYFSQEAKHHSKGAGCPECGGVKRYNTEEFIIKANKLHNYKYNYSKTIYKNSKTPVIIICKYHEEFIQRPNDHLTGKGCIKCVHKISKPEIEWLDILGIDKLNRNIKLAGLGDKKVDGFDPETNTAYEFHGDYWHGNPKIFKLEDYNKSVKKTFGELYQNTIEKEKIIRKSGYNLISIWESDFKDRIKFMSETYFGEVIWFQNGIGFIEWSKDNEKQKDMFVHYTDISCDGFKILHKGQKVSFEIGLNKKNEPKAVNVNVLKN